MAAIDCRKEYEYLMESLDRLDQKKYPVFIQNFLADFAERVAKLQMLYCIAYLRGIGKDAAADMMSQDNPRIGIQ